LPFKIVHDRSCQNPIQYTVHKNNSHTAPQPYSNNDVFNCLLKSDRMDVCHSIAPQEGSTTDEVQLLRNSRDQAICIT